MIVGLPQFVMLLNSDLVISGVLAFLTGMVTMLVYMRVRSALVDRRYSADDTVVQAIVLEYTRRLRDYDRIIADLKARVDIIEARPYSPSGGVMISQPQQTSQQSQVGLAVMSDPVAVTQQRTSSTVDATWKKGSKGTTDYVLKLLAEKPRTSREVQLAVGRTREHTGRLMKKLHDSGLVSRDLNSKPFTYNITEAGRQRLKDWVATSSV